MLELMKVALCCHFPALAKDRKGATALEYGILAGLIALAIIAGVTAFGTALNSFFVNLAKQVP